MKNSYNNWKSDYRIYILIGVLALASICNLLILLLGIRPGFDYGSLLGGMFGGVATLIAFKMTADQTKHQFDIMINKERPRLHIESIKLYNKKSQKYSDIILNINKDATPKPLVAEFTVPYNNLGQSTADRTSLKVIGFSQIDKKVLAKHEGYLGYLEPNTEKTIRVQVLYNSNINFIIYFRLEGEYLDYKLPKDQKVVIYHNKKWILSR